MQVRSSRRTWLLLVGVPFLAGILVCVDLARTFGTHAARIAALATENPGGTRYMERAERSGHPVRHWNWVPLDSVAPVMLCAVILSEDSEFFNIGTLNYDIQRQMVERVLRGDFSRGGSGFAQQLARNLYLGPQRTPRRKAREYLLAWQLSHALTKDRQLELYLNVVEWGDGVWGIDAASRHYFGVSPSALLPSQAVILAVLLPAPRLGFRYAVADRSARKTPGVVRGLGRSMLIDELAVGATIERLERWRRGIAAGRMDPDVTAGIDSIMAPEPRAFPVMAPAGNSLAELCNGRRRAG
jgi:monofunctional biosynthetic peptidoglycan transglycosylase